VTGGEGQLSGHSDHLAICNRYAAYCFAVDDRDPAAMAECFTEDAIVEIAGKSRLEGREAITRTQETPSTHRHLAMNIWVTSREDAVAHVRAYFLVLDRTGNVISHGRYNDELVHADDGAWRWRKRTIAFEWQSTAYAALVSTLIDNAPDP
jgi:3-phenylpropionate/cinnamic acid dioxygenase small subunit